VLAPTYGVILYQEQVMQIAQVLAGYTLGGADLLRRAMGKKKPRRWRSSARSSSTGSTRAACEQARPSTSSTDGEVRGLRLQQVAFRRVRVAVVSDGVAQSALSGGVHGGSAVVRHGQDRQGRDADRRARRMQLKVEPPDVNSSYFMFTVSGERSIRYGLGAIKGSGSQWSRGWSPSARHMARSAISPTCAGAAIRTA
jgi:DNA polymerase-3 subunit alpha